MIGSIPVPTKCFKSVRCQCAQIEKNLAALPGVIKGLNKHRLGHTPQTKRFLHFILKISDFLLKFFVLQIDLAGPLPSHRPHRCTR